MADSPYPELKKTCTMARLGRPWSDVKPAPSAPVWNVIFGLSAYWMLVGAIELGLFDALWTRGPLSPEELAEHLESSASHTAALAEALVVLGLLDRHGGRFDLNDCSRRYLCRQSPAPMADLVSVAPGPEENWTELAATIRRGDPAHPVDGDVAGFWVPLVEGTFGTVLRAATRADAWISYSRLKAPRVADLGAGGAPWSIAVLRACPDGAAVVNDLPEVLEVARARIAEAGVEDRCELRPGDYHTVGLEDGAFDLVVLGHVCRTEGADGARALLGRAADALRPGGRVLVSDYFRSDDPNRSPQGVFMAATMAACTRRGTAFTYEEMSSWLRESGFREVRLIEPIAAQQIFVATKPAT
ncbi:MAG: class I SAM-dependent methyltransferase [bacterium]|nr:class I SAM-dependent methyltransferase [bacterium]